MIWERLGSTAPPDFLG